MPVRHRCASENGPSAALLAHPCVCAYAHVLSRWRHLHACTSPEAAAIAAAGVGVVLIEGRQQFDRMHVHCAGASFYRAESAQARDLAVLAAVVYKRQTGHLRVLDIACGCGGRAARYLSQVCTALLLIILRLCRTCCHHICSMCRVDRLI